MEKLLETIVLKGTRGHVWYAKLAKGTDDWLSQNGWENFVQGQGYHFLLAGCEREGAYLIKKHASCEEKDMQKGKLKEGWGNRSSDNTKKRSSWVVAQLSFIFFFPLSSLIWFWYLVYYLLIMFIMQSLFRTNLRLSDTIYGRSDRAPSFFLSPLFLSHPLAQHSLVYYS